MFDVIEDVCQRCASSADQHSESNGFLLWRSGLTFGFDIMPRIHRLIYECVGFDVVFPSDVPDLPALEVAEQADGLLVKGFEQLALVKLNIEKEKTRMWLNENLILILGKLKRRRKNE